MQDIASCGSLTSATPKKINIKSVLPWLYTRSLLRLNLPYLTLLGILRLELIPQTPGIPVSANTPIVAVCKILSQQLLTCNLVVATRELLIPQRSPRALLRTSAPIDPRDRVVVWCIICLSLPHNRSTFFIHTVIRNSSACTRPPSIRVLPVGGDVCVVAEVVGTMTFDRAELVSWCCFRRGLTGLLNFVAETCPTGEFGTPRFLN